MDNLYTKISLKQTVSIVPHEINNNIVCCDLDKLKNKNYTHCEISPTLIQNINIFVLLI